MTVCAAQLAEEQAQSLAASQAAEERIQRLEQRLASHAQTSTAQAAAGDPPAMPAPGWLPPVLSSAWSPALYHCCTSCPG